MSNLIQWPRAQYWDKAWNPIIGCKPCSPACENCYAAAWAKRFGQSFKPHASTQRNPPGKGVVFCGNMTDLFGEWAETGDFAPAKYIDACMDGGADAYLWLTKRVAHLCEVLRYCYSKQDFKSFEDHAYQITNHYFGFTAEDGVRMDERSRAAFDGFPKWANLWLSAEPLLGPFVIPDRLLGGRLKWLVVGCESGPKRRLCKIEWVESIVDQCRSAGVPVFVKQLNIGDKCVTDISKFPKHLQIRQVLWKTKGENK